MKKIFLTLTLALFVIPLGISQDLPSYVPTNGLVAYYPFNGDANDASGNGNHGAVDGATLTNDKYGNLNSAYSFVGSKEQGNSINLGGSIFNDPNSFSISITVNVGELYVHNDPYSNLFSQMTGGEIQILQTPNYLGFQSKLNNSSWLTCEITPQINQWVNYVYTFSEELNEIVVYTNGDETCRKDINSTLFSYNGPAMIGRQSNANSNYFNGTISDIGFWNRALTEQEVQNLYTSSSGDIKLNGVVSAENNQIKNVADPTESQDAVTLGLLLEKISSLQDQIDVLQSTSCSETVTDQDGNSYGVVELCGKLWTTSNAKTTTYRNGDQINPLTYNPWGCEDGFLESDYGSYDIPCNENFTDHYISTFGYLYDYAMLNDDRLIAPEGWRVPTMEDYQCLIELYPTSAYSLSESDDELTSNLKSTLEVSNYDISYYEDSPHYNNTVVENLRNSGIIWYGNEADPHRDIIINGAWYTSQSINDQLVKMVGTNKSGFDAKPGGFIHPEVAPLGAKIGKQAYFMTKSQNGSRQNEGVVLSITGIEANSLANLSSSLKNGTYGSLRFVKDID